MLEALRSRRVSALVLATGRKPAPVLREIIQEARQQGISVREVLLAEVESLAPGGHSQGVAALVAIPRLEHVRDAFALAQARAGEPFLLILDHVQDPHNFGALLRTGEGAGVQAVIVPDRRSAPLTGAVAKTSAGALSHVPIVEVNNLVRAIDEIKRAGIWVMGLDASADVSLFDADLTVPLALAIGGEEVGLRRLTREHCDLVVRLPMQGQIESLNASVAGSVAMFETVRQRTRSSAAR